ncbi:unnamed protein product [Ilex paraguariensis]|uniref:Uncharacterized protein n=1 Tax=Ilex paraguariensis TaxID=185542 RepID=A0ABC8TZW5_9AQUA
MKDSGAKKGRGMGEGCAKGGIQGNPNANYVRLGDANGASRSEVADDDHGCRDRVGRDLGDSGGSLLRDRENSESSQRGTSRIELAILGIQCRRRDHLG